MKARFFCVHCGNEVPAGQGRCPHCGRIFTAARCPKCGFEGKAARFSRGCPSCGYLAEPLPAARSGRPAPPVRQALPARAYRFFAVLLILLIGALLALLLRR
jgi:predicted RNA-binding Zn-ribbon protein involved in translation (DUF1610 family)